MEAELTEWRALSRDKTPGKKWGVWWGGCLPLYVPQKSLKCRFSSTCQETCICSNALLLCRGDGEGDVNLFSKIQEYSRNLPQYFFKKNLLKTSLLAYLPGKSTLRITINKFSKLQLLVQKKHRTRTPPWKPEADQGSNPLAAPTQTAPCPQAEGSPSCHYNLVANPPYLCSPSLPPPPRPPHQDKEVDKSPQGLS